jgi:hypothetical protein
MAEWARRRVPLGQHPVSQFNYPISRVMCKFYGKLLGFLRFVQSVFEEVSRSLFVGAITLTVVLIFRYWEVQVEIGENAQGWVFWTWKVCAAYVLLSMFTTDIFFCIAQAENADEWSYQKGLEGGWIPEDPTQRQYPGLCS